MFCVTSSSFAILWNGIATDTFKPTKGLRQGDPLSPYLFTIVMEKLSRAIQAQVDAGAWLAVPTGRNSLSLSHLFFADDLLLFSEATSASAGVMAATLTAFGALAGLKVNQGKSSVMFSNAVTGDLKEGIGNLLHFPETDCISSYLGFPILLGRKKIESFQFIVDRLQSKMTSWKRKLLNKAGRATLARSVLAAIPGYYMQLSWLPESTCSQIDKAIRNFIWKGHDGRGLNLVKWETVGEA